jgi:hypothetical protein
MWWHQLDDDHVDAAEPSALFVTAAAETLIL